MDINMGTVHSVDYWKEGRDAGCGLKNCLLGSLLNTWVQYTQVSNLHAYPPYLKQKFIFFKRVSTINKADKVYHCGKRKRQEHVIIKRLPFKIPKAPHPCQS